MDPIPAIRLKAVIIIFVRYVWMNIKGHYFTIILIYVLLFLNEYVGGNLTSAFTIGNVSLSLLYPQNLRKVGKTKR